MNNVGNVTLLQRGDLTDSHSSGSKFVVDVSAFAKETATAQETCDPITSGQPTTEGWLYGLTRLQSIDRCKSLGMNRKKLPKFFFKSCRVGLLLFGWLTVPCPNAKNAWCKPCSARL